MKTTIEQAKKIAEQKTGYSYNSIIRSKTFPGIARAMRNNGESYY